MKIHLAILILLFSFSKSYSCTTFIIKNDKNVLFGRNLDWNSDHGIIVKNNRNVTKKSLVFPPDLPVSWTSKYGSITFNQFGKEFPFGGINEKGLVIEIMLAPASYPKPDTRNAINELQWIQYQLDNCKTIKEVIETDKLIRISKINQNLHFLICDSTGNSAVIEFKKGKMIVYEGANLPIKVLENDVYAESLKKHKNNQSCRFSTACNMIQNFNSNNNPITYSFEILDKVALNQMWSIVYDIKNSKIYFKTASNTVIKTIDLLKFNFDCINETLIYPINDNHHNIVNSYFIPFSTTINKEIFKEALNKSKINLPETIKSQFLNYSVKCLEIK